MLIKLIVRTGLITLAVLHLFPYITEVKFHGDIWGALAVSAAFNLFFFGIECVLAVVAFGINITTLGLGVILTNSLKFAVGLLSPSVALYLTAQVLPGFLGIGNYYPGAFIAGLMLGGIIWASVPSKK